MTHNFRTAKPASQELEDAVRWYESRRRGLGHEFYNAVVAALDSIATHPEIGTPLDDEPNIRRVLIARFPYQVVYQLASGDLVILAFAHLKRRPGFWRHRR